MPSTTIEVRRAYSAEDEIGIIDAVHDALVAAFRIPVQDKHLRLVVHEPHRFATNPELTEPAAYTLMTVDCFSGRSGAAKRALYREIVTRLGPFGIPADHVTVLLRESDTDNWGVRGGQAATDVDLGFEIAV